MTVCQILVQHHPSRAARAAALLQTLGAGTLVPDPEPDGQRSAWRTYRACLEHPTTASHVCVVQDDCLPTAPRLPDLLPRLCRPDRITVLYVGGVPVRAAQAIHRASDEGRCWAELARTDWVPCCGLIWPRELASRFLAWVDAKPNIRLRADDGIIGAWIKADRDVPVPVATVPCLIAHPDDVPSIATNTRKPPRAGANPRRTSCCEPVPGCDLHSIVWEK